MLTDSLVLEFGQGTTGWLVFVPHVWGLAGPLSGVTQTAGNWKIHIQGGSFITGPAPWQGWLGGWHQLGLSTRAPNMFTSLEVSADSHPQRTRWQLLGLF